MKMKEPMITKMNMGLWKHLEMKEPINSLHKYGALEGALSALACGPAGG